MASCTICSATLSLTLPPGFSISAFARICSTILDLRTCHHSRKVAACSCLIWKDAACLIKGVSAAMQHWQKPEINSKCCEVGVADKISSKVIPPGRHCIQMLLQSCFWNGKQGVKDNHLASCEL